MFRRVFDIYEKKQYWKFTLFLVAVAIGVGSLTYTNRLVNALSYQERRKAELWAEATRVLILAEPQTVDLSFPLSVIQNNTTVPVILTDSSGNVVSYKNLDSIRIQKPQYLEKQLRIMRETNDSIMIDLTDGDWNVIFYGNSIILNRLKHFPYIQLAVIILFISVSYIAFSTSRKAEQNKVWIGLSKETAHQLGTPTSSLNAWVELLRGRKEVSDIVEELEKDSQRLIKITDRFSKVGSKPTLQQTNIIEIINESIHYLKSRTSDKVIFNLEVSNGEIMVLLNDSLFEWVLENVFKNAIDAMDGAGIINILVQKQNRNINIDIADTGKGIPKSKFSTIFKPGYTTKQRGWGLGLSLSKRIIEEYHGGKIFVLKSELNKGTIVRIMLKNNPT